MFPRRITAVCFTSVVILCLCFCRYSLATPCSAPASSTAIPDIKLQLVVDGVVNPVAITHAGDGSDRLFILEQHGVIQVAEAGKLQPQPFLDIRDRVVSGGETGLLGIAFHPRFKQNGLFYLNYTTQDNTLTTVISEFSVLRNNRNHLAPGDPGSERVLLRIKQPWSNHNGGQLAFGPEHYLYIATGDGGASNDPQNHGQNLNTLLGAILRIDVDKRDARKPYGLPPDNPYIDKPGAQAEIWAWGLRNPWRFSFDRLTGELYAADVGQDDVEEINLIKKGHNYGWRIMEGNICTPGVSFDCDATGLTAPIYSYDHSVGRSITGGYVYRGAQSPALCGVYLYGDFVNQAVWGLRIKNAKVVRHKTLFEARSLLRLAIDYFSDDGLLISSFGEDEAGEVYVASYASGRVYRIVQK